MAETLSKTCDAAGELTLAQQQRLLQRLVATLGLAGAAPRHIQTHISHVLLHGGHAYKIKKALATPFLDQSTLALRRAACAEELRLNRRLAPQLYLDVVEITGSVEQPVLGGHGPVIEVAVRMQAFDEEELWDRLAARAELGAGDVDELAAVLAAFHTGAAVAASDGSYGTPAQVRPALQDSLQELLAPAADAGWPGPSDREELVQLQRWEAGAFPRLQAVMARRLCAGRVREGHGDLHLGNVARHAGHCLVFDGIEFNAGFRWIDVMSEVAFMAMDLHAHGLPALANRFVNAYLEASGDFDGMRVLGYYLVHRALVRAKVAQLRAAQSSGSERVQALDAARRYLRLASAFARPRPRALIITHGLSGSGKTTLTQGLLEATGAPRIRADVERKRLAGLAPLQGSHSMPGQGLYAAGMNDATYQRLLEAATAVLEGGWPAIVDATFLRHADREAARRCAAALGVPLAILHFDAEPALLRQRLQQRAAGARDASEADDRVLAWQVKTQEALRPEEWKLTHVVPAAGLPGPVPRADWAPLLAWLALAGPREPDTADPR